MDPWGLSASEKRNSNNSLQQNKHYENGLSKTFSSINEYIKELPAIIKDEIWNSVTEFHFEKRDALNKNLPTYEEALRDKNWTLLRPELSIYHDNGFGHPEKNLLIVMVEKRFIHEIFHLMDHINYIQIQNIKEHIIM